jgi:hypothetical protein
MPYLNDSIYHICYSLKYTGSTSVWMYIGLFNKIGQSSLYTSI